jgi:hypothetical protein
MNLDDSARCGFLRLRRGHARAMNYRCEDKMHRNGTGECDAYDPAIRRSVHIRKTAARYAV